MKAATESALTNSALAMWARACRLLLGRRTKLTEQSANGHFDWRFFESEAAKHVELAVTTVVHVMRDVTSR